MLEYLRYFIGPIGKGAVIFLFTFPFTVLLAHLILRRKNISLIKRIGVYAFVFFLLVALGLILFPFPDFVVGFCLERDGIPIWQWIPFYFFTDIQQFSEQFGVGIWKNKAFFQVVFNVFLLLPIGFLGGLFFKWNIKKSLCLTFLISLFFELLQGTGIFGLAPCPYRLFDVDDLFLNTLGGVLGCIIALPWREQFHHYIRQKDFIVKRDNYLIRRGIAYLIDIIINLGIAFAVYELLFWGNIGGGYLLGLVIRFVVFFLYFVVLVYFCKGQSMGKRLFGLHITTLNGRNPKIWQLFMRSLIPVFSFCFVSFVMIEYRIGLGLWNWNGIFSLLIITYLLVFISLSIELSTDGRGLHEKMGRTRLKKKE